MLASKFDEIDDNIPLMEEFCKAHNLVRDSLDSGFLVSHSNRDRAKMSHCRAYPGRHALVRCELHLLAILCWDLNTVTPLHFIQNHLYQGVVFTNDVPAAWGCDKVDIKMLQKVRRHIDYFAMQALKQEFMLTKRFSDQTVAVAIIYAARTASKVLKEGWNEAAFSKLFGLERPSSEVQECYDQLYEATYSGTTTGTSQSNSESFKSET